MINRRIDETVSHTVRAELFHDRAMRFGDADADDTQPDDPQENA